MITLFILTAMAVSSFIVVSSSRVQQIVPTLSLGQRILLTPILSLGMLLWVFLFIVSPNLGLAVSTAFLNIPVADIQKNNNDSAAK